MGYALRTFGISKKYKNRFAVRETDMNISEGDIYGFVGENGSGKTTVIRLITGLIHADAGSFELFGTKSTSPAINEARKKIGAIVESPSIYRNMSAMDNLRLQCSLFGLGNAEEKALDALKAVGLEYLKDEKKGAGDFSLGMRQRLGIAMALIGEPRFIILDEPMNGLDPAGIVEIRELILKLNRENGITFLISSHILTELSLVATKYGIISKGHIIKEITADELHNECGRFTLIRAADNAALFSAAASMYGADRICYDRDSVKISGDIDLNALFKKLIESNNTILSVNCSETSFEEYYLSLVGGMHHA